MRLIDADALIQKRNHAKVYAQDMYVIGQGYVMDAPTIEAAPVVRGEWKLYGNDDDSGMSYWCTACNFQLSDDLFYSGYKNGRWIENGVFKYCPNCGAKMEDKS